MLLEAEAEIKVLAGVMPSEAVSEHLLWASVIVLMICW